MKRAFILGMAVLAAVSLNPVTSKAASLSSQFTVQGNRKIIILGNNCNNIGRPKPEKPKPEKPKPEKPKPEKPGNGEQSSYAQKVLELVNKERNKVGIQPLAMGKELQSAAMARAKEIQKSFSHTRPDGSNFVTVLKEYNVSYKGAGENIAWGQKTPEEVVNTWMNSSGHRANILNKNYKNIGVGHGTNSSNTNYWVQLFTY